MKEIDELKALAEAATEAPWTAYSHTGEAIDHVRTEGGWELVRQCNATRADLEFIAAARNLLPALLAVRDTSITEHAEALHKIGELAADCEDYRRRLDEARTQLNHARTAAGDYADIAATLRAELEATRADRDRVQAELLELPLLRDTIAEAWKALPPMIHVCADCHTPGLTDPDEDVCDHADTSLVGAIQALRAEIEATRAGEDCGRLRFDEEYPTKRLWLACSAPSAEGDGLHELIHQVRPGDTWAEIKAKVAAHDCTPTPAAENR